MVALVSLLPQLGPLHALGRYASLIASRKELVWFENSAHFPQWEERSRFREFLLKRSSRRLPSDGASALSRRFARAARSAAGVVSPLLPRGHSRADLTHTAARGSAMPLKCQTIRRSARPSPPRTPHARTCGTYRASARNRTVSRPAGRGSERCVRRPSRRTSPRSCSAPPPGTGRGQDEVDRTASSSRPRAACPTRHRSRHRPRHPP